MAYSRSVLNWGILERYKCTADSAELAKIAQNRVSGCTPHKIYYRVDFSTVGGLGTGILIAFDAGLLALGR
eukprot:SAG25_NODE_5980_length_599_cov_1.630000_1_plen_71_part_00